MKYQIGKKHHNWKGENAGYDAKHYWLKRHYGKASKCEFNTQHKSKRYEWANISGTYKRSRSDFYQLCPPCHYEFDQRRINRSLNKNSTYGHRGISYVTNKNKRIKRWTATLETNYRKKRIIKYFRTKQEAITAYHQLARQLLGGYKCVTCMTDGKAWTGRYDGIVECT